MYILRHLHYFIRHKYYVWYYASRFFPEVTSFQILTHDLDKLWGFREYAKHFDGYYTRLYPNHPDMEPIEVTSHRFNQPHHWQFWGKKPMKHQYACELVADWLSAAKAKEGKARLACIWWVDQKDTLPIHGKTKKKLTELFQEVIWKL